MRDPTNTPTTPLGTGERNCYTCGGPNCLATLRSHLPPKNLIDLIDRQLHFVFSNHWSWWIALRIVAMVVGVAAPLVVTALLVERRVADIGTVGLFALVLMASAVLLGLAIFRTPRL